MPTRRTRRAGRAASSGLLLAVLVLLASVAATLGGALPAGAAPAAPGAPRVVVSSSSQLVVSWTAVPGASSYRLSRSSGGGTPAVIASPKTTSVTDSGLKPATSYSYSVAVVTTAGTSARSAATTATTLPAAPVGLHATGTGPSSVALAWAPVAGTVRYEVSRATTPTGTPTVVGSPTDPSWTDGTAATAATSYYRVRAVGAVASSPASAAVGASTATTASAPTTPGPVTAQGVSASSMRLSWPAVPGATSYTVGRSTTSGGPYPTVAAPAATSGSSLTVTVGGQAADTAYSYVVRAVGTSGSSGTSTPAWGRTAASGTAPASPTAVSVVATSSTQLRVSWPAVTGASSYTVLRAPFAGGPFTSVATPTSPSFTDSGRTPATSYAYAVRARQSVSSGTSAVVVGSTPGVPAAPTDLTSTPVSASSVTLNWSAVPGATGYYVYRASAPGGPFADPMASTSVGSFTDTGLAPASTYWYAVRTRIGAGTSSPSASTAATTPAETAPPPDPGGDLPVVHVSGDLPTSTWDGSSVHVVDAPIRVPAGSTLTIQRGATVRFAPGSWLDVAGVLQATGWTGRPVVLTSLADDGAGTPEAGDWGGVRVLPGGSASLVRVRIAYADVGLTVDHATATVHGDLADDAAGVSADDSSAVDATMVQWGDPSGPAPLGSGRSVSGAAVTVLPWTGYRSPADVAPTPLPFDAAPRAPGSGPRLAFAHYMPQYFVSDDTPAANDYYTRNWLSPTGESGKHKAYGGLMRDRPLPRAPIGGDFALADQQTEVRQAIGAGLDGFTLDLTTADPTSGNFQRERTLFDAAESVDPGFHIVLMPDMKTLGTLDNSQMAAVVNYFAQSPSAFRLPDGRLVLSPFKAETQPASWWLETFRILRESYGIDVAFVPTFLDWRSNASSFAPISYGFSNWGNRSPASNRSATQAVLDAHAMGKLWMQPVSVQDERPSSGIYDEAGNTENLRATWQAAIDGGAEWVQLPTWNDYAEGTTIAPSVHHGRTFLDLSAWYAARWRTGADPTPVRDTLYVTHRMQPYAATPTYPETTLMKLRSGSTPARDTVEVLSVLTGPATVTVTVGGQDTSFDAPAGLSAHLVPLAPGSVSASAARDGTVVASVSSPWTVTTTPYVQDLQYVGVSSAG